MAKTNTKPNTIRTHEGAKAKYINAEQQLRRSVMACMLFEKQFYEDGVEISQRIEDLCSRVKDEKIAEIAIEARKKQHLRHAPLWLIKAMVKKGSTLVADTLEIVIQRADEMPEFLSIYWKDGRVPVAAQVKKGLARAFTKFNEYQLAKYNRDGIVKLRDVLFISHAKPKNKDQADMWKRLIDGNLAIPDTWEVALSSGANKKEAWTRLLSEGKLGGLALLRNLRNMQQENVDRILVKESIKNMKTDRILPFRFIAAAKYAPDMEPELEQAMFKSLEQHDKMPGRTVLLVDVSGSMDANLSNKSDLIRTDAANGLAMLLREVCEDVSIYTFSNDVVSVPVRRGFALADAIYKSQFHGGTYLGRAVQEIHDKQQYDRLIVITDEQSHDRVPDPKGDAYMINVASYKNGVGYGAWTHIDGWSEAVVDYIMKYEQERYA